MKRFLLLGLVLLTTGSAQAQRFIKVFDNIAAMVAANPNDVHTNVYVVGYRTANDGGGGNFLFVSTETSAADNGFYFAGTHPQAATGKWVRELRAGEVPTPQMFGVYADQSHDDTATWKKFTDYMCVKGGVAYIPASVNGVPCRYYFDSWNITNALPVTFRGDMVGYDKTTSACLIPRANAANWITVQSPTANRDLAGGVTFDGLALRDTTASLGLPGTVLLDVALYIKDGIKSHVRNCSFENIHGSAIKTGYFIQSTIESVAIRYCGSTGHSALDLSGDSGSFPSQSVVLENTTIEACYGAPYINAGLYLNEAKFIGLGFEAESSAADSNWPFIQTEAGAHGLLINDSHFNRNNTNQIKILTNSYGIMVNHSTFRGSITTNAAVWFGGNDCSIGSQCFFNSGKTHYEVELRGLRNTLDNSIFLNSGSVYAAGTSSTVSRCGFTGDLGGGSTAYVIDLLGDNSCAVNNVISVTSGPGGIRAGTSLTGLRVNGNEINGTLGVGFRNQSSVTVASGNVVYNNTGGDFTTAIPLSAGISENNFFGNNPYLEIATVCDPPQIGPFESAEVFVTLTGVAIGDFADASLTTTPDNVSVQANVTGNNRVQVVFRNTGTSPVDITSGTLYVRVRKTWAPATSATTTPTGGFDSGGFYVTGALLRNANVVNGADISPSLASSTNLSFVLGVTGISNGTYGGPTKTLQITYDTKGRATGIIEYSPTNYVTVALSNPNTTVTTANTNFWVAPAAVTIKTVTAHLLVPSSSGSVTVDLKKNGTTVLSAPVSLASGATNATASLSVTAASALDRLAGEITAAGTTAYGAQLKIGYTVP